MSEGTLQYYQRIHILNLFLNVILTHSHYSEQLKRYFAYFIHC